jgi:hypothetical protein
MTEDTFSPDTYPAKTITTRVTRTGTHYLIERRFEKEHMRPIGFCREHPGVEWMRYASSLTYAKPIGNVLGRTWHTEGRAFESREAMGELLRKLARDDEF